MSRSVRVTAVLAGAVIAFAGTALGASAHFTQSLYTYSDCKRKSPSDPLNVAFFGRGAYPSYAAEAVESQLDWRSQQGSSQSFKSHGRCIKMSGQRNLGFWDKHHIRFFYMPDRDSKHRHWVFSDAHRERKKFCGFDDPLDDAVYENFEGRSGFDQGAAEVYGGLKKYARGTLTGPNKRTFNQCTGEKVKWNGTVYAFGI